MSFAHSLFTIHHSPSLSLLLPPNFKFRLYSRFSFWFIYTVPFPIKFSFIFFAHLLFNLRVNGNRISFWQVNRFLFFHCVFIKDPAKSRPYLIHRLCLVYKCLAKVAHANGNELMRTAPNCLFAGCLLGIPLLIFTLSILSGCLLKHNYTH